MKASLPVFEAIEQRRAIEHYDPNHRMTKEEIRQLLSLAMKAPTAFNIQHWRFVVVSDPGPRKQIRDAPGPVGLQSGRHAEQILSAHRQVSS